MAKQQIKQFDLKVILENMNELFFEQLNQANFHLEENTIEKAIEHYEIAAQLAESTEQKIAIFNLLGRLYQKTKKPEKAITTFENSILLYNTHSDLGLSSEKASILNNLAAVYLEKNVKKAIENYKLGLDIYTKINSERNNKYNPHLANTNFALAEAYLKNEDFYNAKMHFKTAIKLYEILPDNSLNALKASAFYQLGNIFTEEFNLFDAQLNYSKSLAIYKLLMKKDEKAYHPFLTAVLNNLGVTYKSLGEYEKALEYFSEALGNYETLSEFSSALFLPFVAATTNSVSIVYAEMKNYKEAIVFAHRTINIYNQLSDKDPQEYTIYLATALHNAGLFYFENKDLNAAEDYFKQALSIRKNLTVNDIEFLDADICSTCLNLVELYQLKLESSLDFSYQKKALQLLEIIDTRLQNLGEDRPVIKSMKSDWTYYTDYYSKINIEELKLKSTFKKVDLLSEDILSTSIPKEKIIFQQQIVEELEKLFHDFSENEKLKNELAYAYNNFAWLFLRLNEPKKAEIIIRKAQKLSQPIVSLQCNLAHSYLIQNKLSQAKEIYAALLHQKNSDNQSYQKIIIEDFETLKKDGISKSVFEKIITYF